jgi:NTE family protein
MKELRMMALIRQMPISDIPELAMLAAMRIHRISSETLAELGSSSKLNAEWDFLTMLRDEGRKVASGFLDAHGTDLGVRSTFDLEPLLQGL